MATFEPHYKLATLMGTHEVDWPVATVKELVQRGEKEFGAGFMEALQTATILVNGRAINYLKGLSTPLRKEDHVNTINLASGGWPDEKKDPECATPEA